MNPTRRNFLKKSGLVSAGILLTPYILPTGRLFASTGKRKVSHVVICLWSGGIRNSEALESNLMPHIFGKTESFNSLQKYGTLIKNVNYNNSYLSHSHSSSTAQCGIYQEKQNLKNTPGIFEYVSKYNSDAKCISISNPLTGSKNLLSNCDGFASVYKPSIIQTAFKAYTNNNPDLATIQQTFKSLKSERPELLVFNLEGSDIAHSNYFSYLNHIQIIDVELSNLWNSIQATEGLKDNTVLVLLNTMGRNSECNEITDEKGYGGLDHSKDENSCRETFCLFAGPKNIIKQNTIINDLGNETIDFLPTVAELMNFEDKIPSRYRNRMGKAWSQIFNT